jgi:PIN domain nuclease of toxin-antitoxin system
VTLLDSFALIAFALEEPAADEVETLLRAGDAAITPVNFAEAVDVLERVEGFDSITVHEVFDPLLIGPLRVVPVDAVHGWRAGEIRARHYRRSTSALSLGDCVLLAAAAPDGALATSDPAVARVARSERLELIPLPDREGRRP